MTMDDVNLKIIFSPEHGLFGEADAGEKISYSENNLNLPEVISLYGKIRKPSAEMLEGIDLILYDIQDIGARYYTYITTLGLVMETAGELGIPILVLDRPNPIRGDIIEGPVLNLEFKSFVGHYPISIRYGGTVGDLAKMIIKQNWISKAPDLTVIPSEGWNYQLWFDETDLTWVDNTRQEISALTSEMLDRLDGVASYTEEDERLRNAFRSLLLAKSNEKTSGAGSHIGRDFIQQHKALFEAPDSDNKIA